MKFIYAEYNMHHNSIDVTTFDGYILRIDCNVAEGRLRTTPGSQCSLDALAIDEPFNSPEFGGIKSLQNLCSLFFQNRHLMYCNFIEFY